MMTMLPSMIRNIQYVVVIHKNDDNVNVFVNNKSKHIAIVFPCQGYMQVALAANSTIQLRLATALCN